MSGSLFDRNGVRKYLTARERFAFARAAYREDGEVATFCLALALTGARISELLALTRERVDVVNESIVLETLKRRKARVFRVMPVPQRFISMLVRVHELDISGRNLNERLWKWGEPPHGNV